VALIIGLIGKPILMAKIVSLEKTATSKGFCINLNSHNDFFN
jgi:hypothetical protein